ncbi:vacuolar protein sorting 39 [Emiliania huxleyi CCMP1516]|uniref:Vacuolar sorting protein 39/Transforming growth factor beta receptor-associated zinc finger domain-containing protein n=2 Tax=Emiliania huxleyi TaxID=2903 RepID=A0A0D3K4J4_EMIH1|nr:vacuolar protein sorting 39 [Emiliania huxleyi CCMP1516]EOD30679.1 vacuolar protein sorting 39 [Emiliania huxleyi CCMP1516]|eukprot:XP_005783108.1 vacuolar protein sorting 39 [Emiliania huxleyi CCMP1516]
MLLTPRLGEHGNSASEEAWSNALRRWPALQPCEALRATGSHEAALSALLKLAEADEPSPVAGSPASAPALPRGAVPPALSAYLSMLGGEHAALLQQYVRWLVQHSHPDAVLPSLTAARPASAAPLTPAYASRLKEAAAAGGEQGALERRLNELLSGAVLSRAQAEQLLPAARAGVMARKGLAEQLLPAARAGVMARKGLAEQLLPAARAGVMARKGLARVSLLSRLERQGEALALLVREGGDPEAARRYCDAQPEGQRAELRLCLLDLYLGGEPRRVEAAVALLRDYGAAVAPEAVLARMPPDAPISQLAPVAEALLGRSSQRRREAQMLRAMEKARSVQLHATMLSRRAGRTVITPETLCSVCSSRIGTADFAAAPGGEVWHVACAGHAAADIRRA